jgi:hypothetical protein
MNGFMTAHELEEIHKDVRNICGYGKTIYCVRQETANELGEPLEEEMIEFRSFPVSFAPFNAEVRDTIPRAGEIDILCYISKRNADLEGITRSDLERCAYLQVDGKRYELVQALPYGNFRDDHIYYLLGGREERPLERKRERDRALIDILKSAINNRIK